MITPQSLLKDKRRGGPGSETERAGPTRRLRRGAGGPEAVGVASGGGGGERRSPAASVTNQRAHFCEGQQRE